MDSIEKVSGCYLGRGHFHGRRILLLGHDRKQCGQRPKDVLAWLGKGDT